MESAELLILPATYFAQNGRKNNVNSRKRAEVLRMRTGDPCI
jgi:hypothetical protein